jgi:hypothetical protein
MLKRLFKILLKVLLLLFVLLFVFLLFERVRGEISLAAYKRELAAKGETLDIHKLLAPPVADADNGAPEFLRIAALIRYGKVLTLHSPPKMKLIAPGKAMVGFRENVWVDDKTNYTWEEVALDLATNKQILDQLQVALARPAFNFKLDHSQGFEGFGTNLINHLPQTKVLCQWFGPAVQSSLRDGNNQAALEDLLAAISIPKVLENDRVIISELVRIAISSINRGTIWEALQTNVWTDKQLAMIQKVWEKNTFATNMIHSLEVERADGDMEFKRFRKSNDETYRAMFPDWASAFPWIDDADASHWWQGELIRKQIYCRVWRFAWSYQDEKFYLAGMDQLIHNHHTGAENATHEGESIWLDLPIAKAPRQNFYDNWRFGMSAQSLLTISRAVVKSARAETDRSMVLCAIALKRYALSHGDYPASVDALVPEFLPSVPVDYMDGKPMKYHLNGDGSFTLYSVGEDGKDDGGDASLPPGATYYQDLWRGKDMVWPQPATPAEVEAWRKAEAKN